MRAATAVAIAAALLASTTAQPGSSWSQFGHDAQHSGRSADAGAQQGVIKFKTATGGKVRTSPAVSAANGLVYFGSWDNNVYAASTTTGSVVWNYTTESTVEASPAIGPDGCVPMLLSLGCPTQLSRTISR